MQYPTGELFPLVLIRIHRHNGVMASTPNEPQTSMPSAARYQPLVVVLAAAAVGVGVDRWLGVPLALWWAAAAAAWLGWLGAWRCGRDRTAALGLLLAVAAVAGAWHHCRWSLFALDDLGAFARCVPQPSCIEAVALGGPARLPAGEHDPMQIIPRGDRTRLELAVLGIRDRAAWRVASGRAVLLVEGHLLGVRAGDRVRLFAQLAAPPEARNPGHWDQADYARADRQRSTLRTGYPDCVSVVRRAGWLAPRGWIDAARGAGEEMLWRHLGPRQAGLAAALLLGDRDELGAERSQAFRETGTVHLLAISGLHVGMLAVAVAALMRILRVPTIQAALVVAVVAIAYTLLTDARPPAVRATVLVLVWTAARVLGRRAFSFNALAAAGLVVLVLNPAELFRIGTQLSFLAVATLMWFGPNWTGPRWFVPNWFGLGHRDDPVARLIEETRPRPIRSLRHGLHCMWCVVVASLTIWLVGLPLLMAKFHLCTPIAVPLGVLLWLPVGVALTSGFVLLGLGWLCAPLGMLTAWLCNTSLAAINWIIDFAQNLPLGHFWTSGPAEWWLVGFYGTLGALAAVPALRPPRRWVVALLVAWIGVGCVAATLRPRPPLECTFLAVGHGAAVVVGLPSGGTLLYDAGCFSSPYAGAQAISECLWQNGARQVDAVVLSHADADHYNALPELLQRFSIGTVYVSPMMFVDENYPLEKLREAIDAAGVPIRQLRAGDRLDDGAGCRIEVLHPAGLGVLNNDNANSLVLTVEYGHRRILLPGDLEPPGLDDLLAEEPWDCDVLMVPHHGSRRSNPPGLAAWCMPETAVISGSLNPDPTATEAAYEAAGATVYNTARVGAVRVAVGPALECGGRSPLSIGEDSW